MIRTTPIYLTRESISDFNALVDRSGGPEACWPWQGSFYPNGYGHFWWSSHCVAFWIEHRRQPRQEDLMHSCDNRACCNPAHISEGTHKRNMEDASKRKRWRNPRKPPTFLTEAEKDQVVQSRDRPAVVCARHNISRDTYFKLKKRHRECPQQ